jgi:AcrR family transcriptional regulator
VRGVARRHTEVPIDGARPGSIGRPRASGPRVETRSPRDEIVAVATRLFAERGFAQTTMSEIARAAGLQQSSLYYWFRRKELILQATFSVNRVPLEFIERIGAGTGSPGLKLYRLVRFDTRQLCLSPSDVNEVERLASQQPDVFTDFWNDRKRLHDWAARLIRAGVEEGQFIDSDPELSALGMLSFNEGVQNWFRYQDRRHPGTGSRFSHPVYDADQVADFLASTTLRGLLRRPSELKGLRAQAARFDDAEPAQPPVG